MSPILYSGPLCNMQMNSYNPGNILQQSRGFAVVVDILCMMNGPFPLAHPPGISSGEHCENTATPSGVAVYLVPANSFSIVLSFHLECVFTFHVSLLNLDSELPFLYFDGGSRLPCFVSPSYLSASEYRPGLMRVQAMIIMQICAIVGSPSLLNRRKLDSCVP